MKLSWGHGIAATYILFALCMIAFVIKASQQNNELVSGDYYEQAVNYQKIINGKMNAGLPGAGVTIKYISNTQSLKINFENAWTGNCNLFFYKPDNGSMDFEKSIAFYNDSIAIIQLEDIPSGRWKIKASWNVGSKKCYMEEIIFTR